MNKPRLSTDESLLGVVVRRRKPLQTFLYTVICQAFQPVHSQRWIEGLIDHAAGEDYKPTAVFCRCVDNLHIATMCVHPDQQSELLRHLALEFLGNALDLLTHLDLYPALCDDIFVFIG